LVGKIDCLSFGKGLSAVAEQAANELWGTFAVDDHLRRRAFVAEAVLFDRLLIPSPPKGNPDEYRDWVRSGWQPDRLLEIRKRLGEMAIAVPWSSQLRKEWQTQYSSGGRGSRLGQLGTDAAADIGDIKRALTRDVIADAMSRPFTYSGDPEVLAQIHALDIDPAEPPEVVVGYGSLGKYQSEAKEKRAAPATQDPAPAGNATLFVTWDFLVPEDSTLSDTDLLLKAIALNSKEEFRDSRRRFHEWRRKLAARGVSVDQAQTEMNRCLTVFNEIVAKERRRTRRLTALQAVAAAAPLADFIHVGVGMVAGAALTGLSIAADKWLPHYAVGARESVAALVHDSREAFGWRPRL
jgi:hypothetical protein